VPARNEADMLPGTLPTLLGQEYPGTLRVIVVDDASTDRTGDVARSLGATVLRTSGPPEGWSGKVAAMAAGVAAAPAAHNPGGSADPLGAGAQASHHPDAAAGPEWWWFTDADIAHEPTVLADLVRAGRRSRLDLVSVMARLRAESRWERWIVPAFVYFFAQLYPFARVNRTGRTAAAAGGCMLVRRQALERAGGLRRIRGALIDDVALGRLLGRSGRIWLGLSERVRSVRAYPRLADLWSMVARSAYHQLRYSQLLLAATVIGLLLVYLVPPAALIAGLVQADPWLAGLGGASWVIMAASYLPMLRFYRLGSWRAATLPVTALLYAAMTLDSARRHAAGRGGEWKGRRRRR
jgi:hopene-associated glycosyltransferase HpnB